MVAIAKPYPIYAICGNWWQESGINPGIYEGLKIIPLTDNSVYGGYGLGQWTNNPRDGTTRRTQLIEWLRSNNYPDNSGPGQLAYFVHENVWMNKPAHSAKYGSLEGFLQSDSSDLEDLTLAFFEGWEGGGDSTGNTRYQNALNVKEFIELHFADEDINTWYSENQYAPIQERYNNAVLVYRILSGGIIPDPPGPGPGSKKRKLPLWMYLKHF